MYVYVYVYAYKCQIYSREIRTVRGCESWRGDWVEEGCYYYYVGFVVANPTRACIHECSIPRVGSFVRGWWREEKLSSPGPRRAPVCVCVYSGVATVTTSQHTRVSRTARAGIDLGAARCSAARASHRRPRTVTSQPSFRTDRREWADGTRARATARLSANMADNDGPRSGVSSRDSPPRRRRLLPKIIRLVRRRPEFLRPPDVTRVGNTNTSQSTIRRVVPIEKPLVVVTPVIRDRIFYNPFPFRSRRYSQNSSPLEPRSGNDRIA